MTGRVKLYVIKTVGDWAYYVQAESEEEARAEYEKAHRNRVAEIVSIEEYK